MPVPLGAGFLFFEDTQSMAQVVGLTIGTVGRAHGLNGTFFVSGRDTPLPKSLKIVRLGPTWEAARSFAVVRSALQGGRPVLQIEGCLKREDAEALGGQTIWAERSALGLKDGEWCFADLVGKTVVSADDQVLGKIQVVANHGAGDFAEVLHPAKGRLGLSLAGDFVDWEKSSLVGDLRLRVNADTFDECWEKAHA